MKVSLPCLYCPSDQREQGASFEIEDDGAYVIECSRGHRSVHTIINPKFEILFEMAILALSEGYARECVATLAASVEEFYRLFVNMVIVKAHSSYDQVLYDNLLKLAKLLDRAEPQLGAFVLAYFLERGQAPQFPNAAWTTFRNSVIHRGKIPKRNDVEKHGQQILDFVIPLYRYRNTAALSLASTIQLLDGVEKKFHANEPTGSSGSALMTGIQWLLNEPGGAFLDVIEFARRESFLRKPAG